MRTNSAKAAKFHILLVAIVLILMAPMVYMLSCSLKDLGQIFSSGLNLIPNPGTLENYQRIFDVLPFWRYVGNSLFIAILVTVCKGFTSILAGYAFTFMDFKYKNLMFYVFTVTMFIPFTVIMIPNYLTLSKMGLINNPIGVMLPQLADAMGIFLMRQSMKGIPKSLLEVARLDKVDPKTPVILKLTLPSVDGFFQALVDHPSVLKVVALSGGYSRDDANARLAKNPGVVASFSRALTEGLSARQSDEEFNTALDAAIESIYRASIA